MANLALAFQLLEDAYLIIPHARLHLLRKPLYLLVLRTYPFGELPAGQARAKVLIHR
ncbi:MAG: hypothetical protein GX455_08040 [Phycisphaerae bacterium]|nr:hypothetical protein [Phycisphaerae bacterium]